MKRVFKAAVAVTLVFLLALTGASHRCRPVGQHKKKDTPKA